MKNDQDNHQVKLAGKDEAEEDGDGELWEKKFENKYLEKYLRNMLQRIILKQMLCQFVAT